MHTPKERVGLSPAAARCCCCHNHTHTSVWSWWRRLRWQWDRLRWGVVRWGSSVCRCVRVHRGYMYYIIYPQYTHTNEQTDDPPVGIERDGVSVCVCVCLLYPRYNIDACTHALKLHTQVVSMQSSCTPCTDLLLHTHVCILYYMYMGLPSYITLVSVAAAPFSSLWDR